jgi:hypothetical protein
MKVAAAKLMDAKVQLKRLQATVVVPSSGG